MKSPFPGMDPYLERHRRDIHHRLVMYSCDQIQNRLPRDLRARVEERLVIGAPDQERKTYFPDVRVVGRPSKQRRERPEESGGGLAVAIAEMVEVQAAEPVRLRVPTPRLTEGFVEIVEAGSREQVVTVIEVLSPSNKRGGPGRRDYRRKQRDLMRAKIGLVEVDLLRRGSRVFRIPQHAIPETHRTTYQVCCRRGHERDICEVYRAPLRDRLPAIRVPLREADPDVVLDLQALVDQCYANGRYDDTDYASEPDPPLDPDDAAWADGLLRERGLRPPAVAPETPGAAP